MKQKMEKNICALRSVCGNYDSRTRLQKEMSFFSAAQNRQNLNIVIFLSSGHLLHPPSLVSTICLRIARDRPKKTLKATNSPNKINFVFQFEVNQGRVSNIDLTYSRESSGLALY